MQNSQNRQSFDFDLMAKLAQESPAEFARLRAKLIDQSIGSFSNAVDGCELQGEIDLERVCRGQGAEASVALAKRLYGLIQQMKRLANELEHEVCK
ncbi:DUF3135 domain-containing protein [Dechloromonas sp. CZR5]|uniref:DUF3135 domain-containing protein n=1 Tax=Dechloromonas sp. CZR5 TaxID=2608630 RepID=UPI00123D45F1|nr:DUF3135 domain-containing protein [Dechloromonas sp. CZR5]